VEHPAKCDTIDGTGMDAEPNDRAGIWIHDDQDPGVRNGADSHGNRSRLQRLSFRWPMKLSQDGPPESFSGRSGVARILRTMSLSMGMSKAKAICGAMRGQPQAGLRCFIGTTTSMSSLLGPFGPGLPPHWDEKSSRYFRFLRAWWRLKRVEGFRTIAERIRRAGRTRRAHKPATRRSEVSRMGERCHERLRIRGCCLTRIDSVTTERMPPGPKSQARVAMTWTPRMTRSHISAR
jgi:hypothetical protein